MWLGCEKTMIHFLILYLPHIIDLSYSEFNSCAAAIVFN